MAQREQVLVDVQIDVDGISDIAKLEAILLAVERHQGRMNKLTDKQSTSIAKLDKNTKTLSKTLTGVVQGFARLFTFVNKFNFIGMAADIGLIALSLGAVKLALISGRFAVQAYQVALKGLGVAAAGVAAVLGTVAAATQEFAAVSITPLLGSLRSAHGAIRGTMGDDLLSFFGTEGLMGAVNALSRSGQIAASTFPTILKGLGNFTTDAKQLASLAETFSLINQQGKITSETLGSLSGVNPVFASAIAEIATGRNLKGAEAMKIAEAAAAAGEITAEEFNKALTGELASTDPWEGQLARMNGTLIGMLKGFVTRMTNVFSALGKPFLDPLKAGLHEIERIATGMVIRMGRATQNLGLDHLIPGLVTAMEKLADFVVKMSSEADFGAFLDRMGKFMTDTKDFFLNIGAVLKPLEAGADAMMTLFGPFFRGIFGARGFGGVIMDGADGFAANADEIERMGEAMGEFAFSFMGIFRDLTDSFFTGTPVFTEMFTILANDVMPVVREFLGLFRDLMREALPTINSLLKEMSGILLPLLQALRDVVGAIGPLGTAALFGGFAMKRGGLSPGRAAGMGLGASVGGVPGMLAGLLLPSLFGRGKAAVSGMRLGGRHGAGFSGLMGPSAGRRITPGMGRLGGALGGASFLGTAGVLGAGTGVGGYFGGQALARGGMGTADAAAVGAGGGALAGAGAGALIGAMGGPIGAAGGALIGLIFGAIGAGLGASKVQAVQRQAKEWTEEQMAAIQGEMSRAFEKGTNRTGIDEARGMLGEFMKESNIEKMAKDFELSTEQMRDVMEDGTRNFEQEINVREDTLERSLTAISDITGMAEQDILSLADVMAVDLSDSIRTLAQDMLDLGLAIPHEEIAATVTALGEETALDVLFGPNSAMGRMLNQQKALSLSEELNAMGDAIEAASAAGDVSGVADGLKGFSELAMQISTLKFGTKGTGLMFAVEEVLRQGIDPRSSGFFGGGEAGNQASAALADIEREKARIMSGESAIWDPLRVQLDTLAAQTGDRAMGFDAQFDKTIVPQLEQQGIEFADQIAIAATTNGSILASYITSSGSQFAGQVMAAANYFGAATRGAMGGISFAIGRAASDAARHASAGRGSQTNSGGTTPPPYRRGPNPPDTPTQRRHRAAMGFHSRLAGRFGGKFSMSSSLRSNNLGSTWDSDHLAGGAYDITGNNLGQYSEAVNKAGGFAEFHGTASSRHLHVVPPVGDTATPAMTGANSGGGGGGIGSVQIIINGAGDPNAVANLAVKKIEGLMRDHQERR